ncbi:MAG: hypothetical protein GY757_33995, partial [bacterium]|nr:hypothetical protein [bacterium]
MKPHQHTKYLRQMFWKPNTIPWCNVLLMILLLGFGLQCYSNVYTTGIDSPRAYLSHYQSIEIPAVYIDKNGDVSFKGLRPKIDMSDPEKAFKKMKEICEESKLDDIEKVRLIAHKRVRFGRIQQVLRC